MKIFSIILCFVLFIQYCVSQQQQQGTFKMKGNFMDVPVKASYMIGGSDDDGFLEDGIIVKTKGTGYIDQRYRNRDPYRASASQIIYGRPGMPTLYGVKAGEEIVKGVPKDDF